MRIKSKAIELNLQNSILISLLHILEPYSPSTFPNLNQFMKLFDNDILRRIIKRTNAERKLN